MTELEALAQEVRACAACDLCQNRTVAVPGEGPEHPEVLFIGEGPGFHEDQQGRPFVGPAGRLLDELLASIGMSRRDVYITNVVKCRPPNNRDPLPAEIDACHPYLARQIALLEPRVIVTLGRFSLTRFLPGETISRAHGKPRRWNTMHIFPMYHPAAALHQQSMRRFLEEDIRQLPPLLERLRREAAPETPTEPEPQQLKLL